VAGSLFLAPAAWAAGPGSTNVGCGEDKKPMDDKDGEASVPGCGEDKKPMDDKDGEASVPGCGEDKKPIGDGDQPKS
jgi:hypothetical protein